LPLRLRFLRFPYKANRAAPGMPDLRDLDAGTATAAGGFGYNAWGSSLRESIG
jgi:hypothetical protein